jgi:cell division protein FtsL
MVVMILGLVALNALLAQSSFQIEALQSKVDRLTESYQQLSVEAAELASPQRIAEQAKVNGLYLPAEGIHVLHAPSGGPARPNDQAAGERR